MRQLFPNSGEVDPLDETARDRRRQWGLAPLLVGGDARRILDGDPLEPPTRLELRHVLAGDGCLFVRYRRR